MKENIWNVLNNVGVIFSIVAPIGAAIKVCVGRFLPYLKIRVRKYGYYNIEVWAWLINYEVIGGFFALLIACLLAVAFGPQSTREILVLEEHIIALLAFWWIYVSGLVCIIYKMRESYRCKYIANIVYASVMYIILPVSYWSQEVEGTNIFLNIVMGGVIILQFLSNFDMQKIKDVQIVAKTIGEDGDKKEYEHCDRVIKQNSFCVICCEDGKKLVEVPYESIVEICTSIKDVEQSIYRTRGGNEEMSTKHFYKKIYKNCKLQEDVTKRKDVIVETIEKGLEEKTNKQQIHILEDLLNHTRRRQEIERLVMFFEMVVVIMIGIVYAMYKIPLMVYLLILLVSTIFIIYIYRIRAIYIRGCIETEVFEYRNILCSSNMEEGEVLEVVDKEE